MSPSARTAPRRSSGRRATSSASASCRCSRRSSPGYVRSRLPASAPEQGEPFSAVLTRRRGDPPAGDDALAVAAVLRVLRASRAPSPRSSPSSSRRRSTRTRSSGARRRRRPSSRASSSTGWRSCSGCRPAGTGTSRTRRRRRRSSALAAARELAPDRRVVVASEHAHSSVEKAVKILGLELRQGAGRRRLPAAPGRARPRRRVRRRRDGRDDVDRIGRSGAGDRRRVRARQASGSTSMPRTRGRRWCARSCAGRSRASTAPTRSSSTRTSGCSCPSTARSSGAVGRRRCARRSASCPSTCGRRTRSTASASTARRSAAASGR